MSTIVTILLEDDLLKKLRALQSSTIKKEKKNVSFSEIVRQTLKKSL